MEIWGFPGYWTFLVARAMVVHPAGRTVPSPIPRGRSCCLRSYRVVSAPGIQLSFRAAVPRPTRLRTYASSVRVATTDARPRYSPVGLNFGEVGVAPTGRHTEFQEVITSFLPLGPALPGRTL